MAFLLGALIGTFFIGGLFGWIVHKVTRQPYGVSDAIGLTILVGIAGFTNSSAIRSIGETWGTYGVAAVLAYFILQRVRAGRAPSPLTARAEPEAPLQNSEPQSAEAATIAMEEEIVASVRAQYAGGSRSSFVTPTKAPRQNFIARHWRGELSLPVSYWIIGVVATLVIGAATAAITLLLTPEEGFEPVTSFAALAAVWIVTVIVMVWQLVGLWRCAQLNAERRQRQRESAFWPRAAQVMAVLALLQTLGTFYSYGMPQLRELSRMAFQNDPDIPDATLTIADEGRTLLLDGGIKYGLARELDTILRAAPSVTAFHVSSYGGRIAEAIKVFDLVRAHGLDTFVSDECSSACTLIFVAGTNRLVGQGARLGFHGSAFPGATTEELESANAAWASVYEIAGVSRTFLRRALSVDPSKLWYPTEGELAEAGVTRGSIEQAQYVPASFAPMPTLASVRAELLSAGTIYQALDQYAPEGASRAYAVGLDFALGRISAEELRSKVNDIITQEVVARLPRSDDQTLVAFAALAADEYGELLAKSPRVCFEYVTGTNSYVDDVVSDEMFARKVAMNERILRGASMVPAASQSADAEDGWNNVYLALDRSLLPEQFNVFILPPDQVREADYGTYCLASSLMMREISNLPRWQAGPVVRSMFDNP